MLEITGQVIADNEQSSVTGVRIEAWDKDIAVTDRLGAVVTDSPADFVIVLDAKPRQAIYFKVFDARVGQLIANTEDTTEWRPGSGKVIIRLALKGPGNVTASLLSVAVYDLNKNRLSGEQANVTARANGSSDTLTLEYRPETVSFQAQLGSQGEYEITVLAGDWHDSRRITVAEESHGETFIVGQPGMPAYYRGKVRVPFAPQPELLAILIRQNASSDQQQRLDETAQSLHLERAYETGDKLYRQGIRLYRYTQNTSEEDKRDAQNQLRKQLGDKAVASIVSQSEHSVSLVGQHAIVRFKKGTDRDNLEKFLSGQNLQIVQSLDHFSENTYLVRLWDATGYDLLTVLEKLVNNSDNQMVEFAEPVLTSTMNDDTVNPSNSLFHNQWSLDKIAIREAWDKLAANNHQDRTFGDPSVTIAVLDQGVETETAVDGVIRPNHPALQGQRFDVFFDFRAMTQTNESCQRTVEENPEESHGIQCSGIIAAATSTNAAPPSNMAGVASNCRIMSLVRPDGDTASELDYANCYLWAAGLLPSLLPDFHPSLTKGADIIVSCFGPSAMDFPISGLMQQCFNTLTNQGRHGKGTLLFFSVGNNSSAFTIERPWAAYDRTIAVAATTSQDTHRSDSNYSSPLPIALSDHALIDVCAPGDQILTPVFSTDPAEANLPTGYRNFSGTSAATPIVAGVAALMLSANPALTWQQVRNILRATAIRIDPNNADPKKHGQWLRPATATTDPYYSGWYGYGQVNANAAVRMALDYIPLPDPLHQGPSNGVGVPG